MLIAVISDTHDNAANLQAAVEICRRRRIALLFHCGDLTNPEMATALAGFEVIYTFGNIDRDIDGLRRTLLALNPANCADHVFYGEVGGQRVAAAHGQNGALLDELARQACFAWIFHGHTHRRRDVVVGRTRIICPGALGGTRHETRSFCLLDPASGWIEFVYLPD